MTDKFTCAICARTFTKGQSDEEALAELKANFDVPVEDCDLVCDDCFKEMGLADV